MAAQHLVRGDRLKVMETAQEAWVELARLFASDTDEGKRRGSKPFQGQRGHGAEWPDEQVAQQRASSSHNARCRSRALFLYNVGRFALFSSFLHGGSTRSPRRRPVNQRGTCGTGLDGKLSRVAAGQNSARRVKDTARGSPKMFPSWKVLMRW